MLLFGETALADDVCTNIKNVYREDRIGSFIAENQKAYKINGQFTELCEKGYRCDVFKFPLGDVSSLVWVTQTMGTASCQIDTNLVISNNSYLQLNNGNKPDKRFMSCGEGDCCGNGHDYFVYLNRLYDLEHETKSIFQISDDRPRKKLCSFTVTPKPAIDYTNYKPSCSDSKLCSKLINAMKEKNMAVFDTLRGSDGEANVPFKDKSRSQYLKCIRLDFNNDKKKDAICSVIDSGPRWENDIELFINLDGYSVEPIERKHFLNPPKDFYIFHQMKSSREPGEPSDLFFMDYKGKTYFVFYHIANKEIIFRIFLTTDDRTESIGTISTKEESPIVMVNKYK
jgi:hypothetical protein